MIKAWWGSNDGQSAEGLDADAVEALLRQLSAATQDRPVLVDLIDDGDDVLTVGIGSDHSVLMFASGSGDPPYLISSPEIPVAEESRWFDYDGAESEVAPLNLVSLDQARHVLRQFVRNGDRSGVRWSEV